MAPWKRFRGNFDTKLALNVKAPFPLSLFIWLLFGTLDQVLLLVTDKKQVVDVCFSSSLQLYELDRDPKRKEFLDDLFSFMQKRGG